MLVLLVASSVEVADASEETPWGWGPLCVCDSTNAATSKESLTSHIAAILLSISTVMMESLP